MKLSAQPELRYYIILVVLTVVEPSAPLQLFEREVYTIFRPTKYLQVRSS